MLLLPPFSIFCSLPFFFFFFFNDTATTEIYTLSLHDALPIYSAARRAAAIHSPRSSGVPWDALIRTNSVGNGDRKSTRLNSSHGYISYAVFCLKKKKKKINKKKKLQTE